MDNRFEISVGGITVRGRGNAAAAAADIVALPEVSAEMEAIFAADEARIERLAEEYYYDRSVEM